MPGAIRNSKYKLLHTYDSGLAGSWYTSTEVFLNDDDLSMFGTCTQSQAWVGDYTYYLFDLENDPYETTNLYDTTPEMQLVQAQLFAQLDVYAQKALSWASVKRLIHLLNTPPLNTSQPAQYTHSQYTFSIYPLSIHPVSAPTPSQSPSNTHPPTTHYPTTQQ